ncbi:glycosyltransferase [Fusobacterium sp. SB021]
MISKWEGFGLVVCEYMASLKPVIAVNVGGVKNIIENNINGIMINEYSSEKFADKILEIKNDNLLKERLIEKAYKYVKARYSIENEVKKIEVEEVL